MRKLKRFVCRIKHAISGILSVDEMIALEGLLGDQIDIGQLDFVSQEYIRRVRKIPLSFLNTIVSRETIEKTIDDSIIHAIELQLDVEPCEILDRVDDLMQIRQSGRQISIT